MGEEIERHTSYGRGGAGNMRRNSLREQAKEALANMSDNPSPERRRSSVWSLSSNGERSWKNIFRRSSVTEEPQKIQE